VSLYYTIAPRSKKLLGAPASIKQN